MTPRQTKDGVPYPTGKDWDKISAMYLRNDDLQLIIDSFPDLHLTKTSILKHMDRYGYSKAKKDLDMRVKDHLIQITEDDKIKTNQDCIRLFESGAKIIEKLLAEYDVELRQGEYSKAKARATAYNIDLLMSGVTKVQKGLRVAYGMDKDGKLYEKEPEVLVIEGVNVDKI